MEFSPIPKSRISTQAGLLVCALLSVAMTCQAADESQRDQLPLGHPNFYPSPERPIGWRGDGNGAFPAATPVESFSEGPFKELRIQQGKRKKKVHIATDGEPTNIVWKHELPGWTHAQPIIVGDRAIQTCEPRTILCIDMNTGKEIWRQELCPFKMLGLEGPELEAAKYWESAAWTLTALRYSKTGNYTRLSGKAAEKWPVWKAFGNNIAKIVAKVEPQLPDLAKTAKEKLQPALDILNGEPTDDKKIKDNLVKSLISVDKTFTKAFHTKFGFPSTVHWYSYVGWTWPTPVCDGTWLYCYMSQGQIARVALKDGKIDWIRRISDVTPITSQPLPRSPILHKGVLYMLSYENLFALDPETGKELWRFKNFKVNGTMLFRNTAAVGIRMVTLPSGRDVLALGGSPRGTCIYVLIDPKTGEELLRSKPVSPGRSEPGPSLMSVGDLLMYSYGGQVLRIADEGGKITATEVWKFKNYYANVQIIHDNKYYSSHAGKNIMNIYDFETGKQLLPKHITNYKVSNYRPGIIVGDKLIGSFRGHMYPPKKINDGWHYNQIFLIHNADGSGTTSRENILQIKSTDENKKITIVAPQAAPFMEYVDPIEIANICTGIPPTFGWGGPYAHANRILIPSTKHLYCIGDPSQPYSGKP